MKKMILAGLAAAMSVTMPSVASAAVVLTQTGLGTASGTFGGTGITATASFSNVFNFVSSIVGSATASVTTTITSSGLNVNFTSITLDGNAFTQVLAGTTEVWSLTSAPFSGASHVLTLNGNAIGRGAGSYGGQLDITAVPEPLTWGMMLAGLGFVGGAMRSRRRTAASVLA
jgi:hypothetical protein